ncbi:MAG: potassium transporter Kup [Ramlibacter sp.]
MQSKPLLLAAVGALGVVYGDIGTSPLYTLKQVFSPATGIPLDQPHIVGVASTILWALMIVVTLKYVVLILRADNHGEGGIMALTALASQYQGRRSRLGAALLTLGILGAALFYGDSIITPAISVLSAVEGLEVSAPSLKPFVLPISVAVLIGLFLVQRKGSAVVGHLFGPVMVLWLALLAATGLYHAVQSPEIWQALDPRNAWWFLRERGWGVFAAMGAIVLALTGAEALYADLGHFGKLPIRVSWLVLVLPALALSYLGQSALLLRTPAALSNPFFQQFSSQLTIPVVIFAAIATVIASQAVISGAFSMTKQAIQLGLFPRLRIEHTSDTELGQIYLPQVNWVLLMAVLAVTVGFGTSDALASAYGIAVTLTMLITTLLTFFVVHRRFRIPLPIVFVSTAFFGLLDLLLVMSCAVKFVDGGWFPLGVGALIFTVMTTWRRGGELLATFARKSQQDLSVFLASLESMRQNLRVGSRVAVFPVLHADRVPPALLHNLKHNEVLHQLNVIAAIEFIEQPNARPEERLQVREIANRFWLVQAQLGFKDSANLPALLRACAAKGLAIDPDTTSYFLSRPTVVASAHPQMSVWRERLFSLMLTNATSVANYYQLPNSAVVELGSRVEI